MASGIGPTGPSSSLGEIERPRGSRDFPGPFQAVGLTVALGFLMVGIGSGLSRLDPSEAAPGLLGTNALAAAIVLGWGVYRTGQSAGAIFRFRAFSPGLLLPMAVFLLGASVVLSDFDNAVRWAWPMPPEFEELFRQLLAGGFLSLLLLVIEAPVIEELVFRGLILRGLIARRGVRQAIVLQAILFAALHLNPWQFVPAFFIGLFLGLAVCQNRFPGDLHPVSRSLEWVELFRGGVRRRAGSRHSRLHDVPLWAARFPVARVPGAGHCTLRCGMVLASVRV